MNITPIIAAVIGLIVAIFTCILIPLATNKLSTSQLATARMWVQIAVSAAEQLYKGTGKGVEKKAYVLAFLESKNLKIDTDSLNNLIEASVLELKTAFNIE